MKANWIVEFLQDHDFEYERNVGKNEVWRNQKQIMIIHPADGLKLIYHLEMFNEHYTESVIEGDIERYDYAQSFKKTRL